jgi:hypothetical protein
MLNPDLILFDDTDKQVAAGVRRCLARLTPKHSVTSRRYAISTLIKEEIDDHLARVLATYSGGWSWPLLDGFQLSRAWLTTSQSAPAEPEGMTSLERAVWCADLWRAQVHKAARSARAKAPKPSPRACETFCSTLDTVMALIDALSAIRPHHTHGPDGSIALKAKGQHAQYCELCWRETEHYTAGPLRDAEDQRLGFSRRFCNEHNPQSAASNYRRDLKFKEAFANELKFIRENGLARKKGSVVFLPDAREPSGMALHLVPASAHQEDVRRAAYALVHSGLQGTASQCLAFEWQGLPVPQIAAHLGITARAVRLAIARAHPKLKQAELARVGGMPG